MKVADLTLFHDPDPEKTVLLEVVKRGKRFLPILHIQRSYGWVGMEIKRRGDTREDAEKVGAAVIKNFREQGWKYFMPKDEVGDG